MAYRDGPIFEKSSGMFSYHGVTSRRPYLTNMVATTVAITLVFAVTYGTYLMVNPKVGAIVGVLTGVPAIFIMLLNCFRRYRDIRGTTEHEELHFIGLFLIMCIPYTLFLALLCLGCIPGNAVTDTAISDYFVEE